MSLRMNTSTIYIAPETVMIEDNQALQAPNREKA